MVIENTGTDSVTLYFGEVDNIVYRECVQTGEERWAIGGITIPRKEYEVAAERYKSTACNRELKEMIDDGRV